MRFASTLIVGVLLAIGGAHAAAGTSLLFIGNSFTFWGELSGAVLSRRHGDRSQ